jgi:hypothetical protein
MARRGAIMRRSAGIDYEQYVTGALAFDYERLMADTGYDLAATRAVQRATGVGDTPLVELENITALVRCVAGPGKGARIFVKDEAANPSGSFKDRRASLSVHEARRRGYEGVVAATSGNYGAAVASQAAKLGLRCIVVQEAFDSHAVAIALELDENCVVVVQETEYTGAGKHPLAQLNLARRMGVEIRRGDPADNEPGRRIVIPEHSAQIRVAEVDLDHVRRSYVRNALNTLPAGAELADADIAFLAAETRTTPSSIEEIVHGLHR